MTPLLVVSNINLHIRVKFIHSKDMIKPPKLKKNSHATMITPLSGVVYHL